MPYRGETVAKARLDNPIRVERSRNIAVYPGAKWMTGSGDDYVIPLGTPMAPLTAGTGLYKPIRRTVVNTAATAGESILNAKAGAADGFEVGDVVIVLQNGAKPTLMTVSTTGTISTIDYTTGVITLTNSLGLVVSAGCFFEVAENGAATMTRDCVFLGENIKTRDTDLGVNLTVLAVGYQAGQVEVVKMDTNCYDALTPAQFPDFDFIPEYSGQAD